MESHLPKPEFAEPELIVMPGNGGGDSGGGLPGAEVKAQITADVRIARTKQNY